MTDTIALITGANKGIGYEISARLAATGATVLIGSRDPDRGRAAAATLTGLGGEVRYLPVDVTDPDSIAAAAKWIGREFGRLDILVNNAGVLLDIGQKPSEMPLDLIRRTYEVNVFGVVAVTNAMLPLLRLSAAGRIVNVSSGLGSLTLTSDQDNVFASAPMLAYNTSKSALNAITVSYANELRDTPITVNAADPGYCATDLNHHSGPRTAAQGANAAVALALAGPGSPTGTFVNEDSANPW